MEFHDIAMCQMFQIHKLLALSSFASLQQDTPLLGCITLCGLWLPLLGLEQQHTQETRLCQLVSC
jgi:hypothetical protein